MVVAPYFRPRIVVQGGVLKWGPKGQAKEQTTARIPPLAWPLDQAGGRAKSLPDFRALVADILACTCCPICSLIFFLYIPTCIQVIRCTKVSFSYLSFLSTLAPFFLHITSIVIPIKFCISPLNTLKYILG
ncbi:unnamed protein product [Amaranthus hypochondriacus]